MTWSAKTNTPRNLSSDQNLSRVVSTKRYYKIKSETVFPKSMNVIFSGGKEMSNLRTDQNRPRALFCDS